MERDEHISPDRIHIFKGLFTGLKNVYGTYNPATGHVRQVKEPVTDDVIRSHLTGKQSYGVYLLTGQKTVALAVDFDEDELCLPVAFVAGARRFDLSAYIERSKSKGYHVWMFFEHDGVSARKARLVAHKILADIGRSQTEVFPKQDTLNSDVSYGNFIHAPLFGALVGEGRTVFMDPAEPSRAYVDQWELLSRVRRIDSLRVETIIRSWNLDSRNETDGPQPSSIRSASEDTSCFGLPPCARHMLAHGVTSHQRVSCFRLAIHLKRNGIPLDLALGMLMAWARKNRPSGGKRIITEREIEYQAKSAFENRYRSFGCEDPAVAIYCDKNCPVYPYTVGRTRP